MRPQRAREMDEPRQVGWGGRSADEPSVAPFALRLKAFRAAAGLTQRALARASAINSAIISRMESADRGPSGPEQVLAIARALALSPEQTDALLTSAGFWPAVFLSVGPQDETLLRVAQVLASRQIPEATRARFRRVIDLLVQQWLA